MSKQHFFLKHILTISIVLFLLNNFLLRPPLQRNVKGKTKEAFENLTNHIYSTTLSHFKELSKEKILTETYNYEKDQNDSIYPWPKDGKEPLLYVIPDIHGDFKVLLKMLFTADLIDSVGNWKGGQKIVVQLGDIADRGPDAPLIYVYLLWKLLPEAAEAGGRIFLLFGNHELSCAAGLKDYVSPVEMQTYFENDFQKWRATWDLEKGWLGSKIMKEFEPWIQIGATVFSHAGLFPEWARVPRSQLKLHILETLSSSEENGDHLSFKDNQNAIHLVFGNRSPFFNRALEKDCQSVKETLEIRNASFMIVGHTPLDRMEAKCDGKFIMTDTGASAWMKNNPRLLIPSYMNHNNLSWNEWALLKENVFNKSIL